MSRSRLVYIRILKNVALPLVFWAIEMLFNPFIDIPLLPEENCPSFPAPNPEEL